VTAGRFPSREQLAADASRWTRYQHVATAVLVRSFHVTQVTEPDEPVPYRLDDMAWTVPCPDQS
jgi:hypothetical protein